ncbi:hypothetical protein D3C85_1131200 [compost metagenome]
MLRQTLSRIVADRAGGGQDAGRLCIIAEELRGGLQNAHVLQGRQVRRRNRRQADQRVERADAAIVDDLRRRHDQFVKAVREQVQVVGVELVEHLAAVRHERHNTARVEDVHPNDDAAVVALLEHVHVALRQPGQRPVFSKLLAGLVVVRLA